MSVNDPVIEFADTLSLARRAATPKVGDPLAERATCVECGKRFTRSRRNPKSSCPACSRARQIEAGVSMRRKDGEIYERTVRGQLRYWSSEADRLGITTDE